MLDQNAVRERFWAEADMPLSRWNTFVSNDIDAVHDHMTRVFCPHQLTIEGGVPPVSFRHNHATLKTTTFNATSYGTPYGRVSVVVPAPEEIFLIQYVLSGHAQFTHQGDTYDLRPGYMMVLSPHEPVRQITHAGCRHFTIKISRAALEAILALDLGRDIEPLSFSPEPTPLESAAASFSRLIRTICDDLEGGLSAYVHPRAAGAMEDTLGRLLLACAPHNHTEAYAAPQQHGAAPYYVRRVEDYIRAHYAEPISLTDLIRVAGVSGRSLHAGFRRFRDDTPMGHLRNYRLERARALLQLGVETGVSVTDVALATGFLHPSRFAQDYCGKFGELPSWTLKRMGRA